MKLIALVSIMSAAGIARPGSPFSAGSEDEGNTLIQREFARLPTSDELAKHWPAEHAAEQAVAAKAAAAAEAAAKAEAEAKAKAEADAKAKADADAKAAAEAEAAAKAAAAAKKR